MVVSLSSYSFVYLLLTMVAISIQLTISTSIGTVITKVYSNYKALRAILKGIAITILVLTVLYFIGDRIISFIFSFASEYRQISIVGILSFFALWYIQAKGYYEFLNVFGAIIFMLWLFIFSGIFFTHVAIQHHWFSKSVELFQFLVVQLPEGFKILPYLIVFCFIMLFIILNIINISRINNIIVKYINDRIKETSQDRIIELIYNESHTNLSEKAQRSLEILKRYRFTRTIFTDELLRMHEIIFGNINDRINHILTSWEVINDARYYLHHRKWHYKIKGLRVYAQLDDKSEMYYIKNLISAKNHVLRIEAQITVARLSNEENPLDYLKDLQNKLTLWEQINLIHYFTRFNKQIGNIKALLNCENTSVTFFGLRLAGIYNQYEHYNQVLKLTKVDDILIQNTAYEALSQYQEPASADYILKKFNVDLPISTRIAMIRALGHIGNTIALPFMKDLLLFEVEYQLSIELFKAIMQLEPATFEKCDTVGDMKIIILGEFIHDSKI